MGELEGARALVTGAAGRIGRATAVALAAAGARVAASDLDPAGLAETMSLLGGTHEAIVADLSTVPEVERLVADAAASLGGVDVLVNNAAILTPGGTVLETTPEAFDRTIAVNTRAPYFATRTALPYMLDQGRGSIVNIASILALVGLAGYSPYAVSKIGMVQLTRQVAVEYGSQGIRCNAVCPGATTRPGELDGDDEKRAFRSGLESQYPVARLACPEEIASVVRFLAGDGASFMNGAIVVSDGGYTSQ